MTTHTLAGETLTVNHSGSNSIVNNNGPIAHLDHMLNSLHDEQSLTRLSNTTGSIDPYDSKSHRINPRSSSRNNMTDGKIVECSSENSVVYRYYTGESSSIIDEHFDKSLKQPTFNSTRSLNMRESNDLLDSRTSSYAYPGMMSSSTGFWPNFMTSSTPYTHPTYLPTSQNDYSEWMHHHHTYRSPYATNNTAVGSSSSTMVSSMNNNHLHPIGSPTSSTNNNVNNNRYHHHAPSDMDVVTAAAIGAAAAAQMFHHEKQSHHAYTPTTHHFDYHLGGSMMASTPYGFPTQGFDLMSSSSSSLGLENSNMKEATTSSPWYSNHHLSCQ